ncbi:hypothetical protein DFR50_103100 [Roseiarcus fermentans]|uniref:Uncharacterized protein n=1 Tax=Roseiarcus fermentans TaxID=1473586 RepID=A0A366FTZ9_9HYPH|nr:hypothetical protein DFR50_103100 [Roseiarcus fermentans]
MVCENPLGAFLAPEPEPRAMPRLVKTTSTKTRRPLKGGTIG